MGSKLKYKDILTKDFLKNEYFVNGKALRTIAEETKINVDTVTRYFKDYGFEIPKIENIVGKTYGYYTVIKLDSRKASGYYWLCRCKCGTERVVSRCKLISGKSLRCIKCLGKSKRINKRVRPDVVLGRIKSNLRNRPLEFNLDEKYIMNLYYKQRGKCALSGIKLVFGNWKDCKSMTASIDRIDSNLGYIKGNVQWVHKDINNMKSDYDDEYFIQMCKEVAKNNK